MLVDFEGQARKDGLPREIGCRNAIADTPIEQPGQPGHLLSRKCFILLQRGRCDVDSRSVAHKYHGFVPVVIGSMPQVYAGVGQFVCCGTHPLGHRS